MDLRHVPTHLPDPIKATRLICQEGGGGAKELIIPHSSVDNRIITFVSQAQRRQVI